MDYKLSQVDWDSNMWIPDSGQMFTMLTKVNVASLILEVV